MCGMSGAAGWILDAEKKAVEDLLILNIVRGRHSAGIAAVDRTKTPWVIVIGHRSIYCSCDADCDAAATTVRTGTYGLEELFRVHAVDLWIGAHEHNVERNYAVFNGSLVTGGSSGAPGSAVPEVIRNARAPIYIIEGCAGNSEHHEPFTRPQPAYSGSSAASRLLDRSAPSSHPPVPPPPSQRSGATRTATRG